MLFSNNSQHSNNHVASALNHEFPIKTPLILFPSALVIPSDVSVNWCSFDYHSQYLQA